MNKRLKVLIAEDNSTLAVSMCNALNNTDFIEVVAIASNGKEAIELIRTNKIDVLILDLIMPVLDGIGVLENINSEGLKVGRIMVLSAIGHEDIVQKVMTMGVHYYMIKPFDVELLAKRLKPLSNNGIPIAQPSTSYNISKSNSTMSLEEEITSIFLSIGIPAHIKGYQFLKVGVKLIMNNPRMINAITKQLYPGIAKEFDTTASKVERAIRHAIEVAWNRGRIENINDIFGYNIYTKNDKPTNGEFIALIADKLSIERSA